MQNYNPKSDNESSRFYSIIINKGDTLRVVSNKLYDSGLIKNKEFFKFFAKLHNFEKTIKLGTVLGRNSIESYGPYPNMSKIIK